MRLLPDQDVRRVDARWLGPAEFPLPFHARYLAWGMWVAVFTGILLFEMLTPLSVGLPIPVWELSISILVTTALMGTVDHERPLRTTVRSLLNETRAPRRRREPKPVRVPLPAMRVREQA